MKMTWRWFGEGNDSVSLAQIRQVPGVGGIVWSLHDKVAGEVWEEARIQAEVERIQAQGFHAEVVESVNIHDSIKIGSSDRDRHIDVYIDTLEKLARHGVKVICYNFMPVFDWVRTDLYHPLPDGSNALFYQKAKAERDPREVIQEILEGAGTFTMPGWEPERLARIEELFQAYAGVDEAGLTANLRYFLEAIIPVCERCGVKMAVHPDDPPWPLYGLPRIVRSREHIRRYLAQVDSPCNGLTLCTGSLGADPANDIPALIREFGPRIHFAHIRNLRHLANGDFVETSHRTADGSLDIRGIVEAFHQVGFTGYVRPDHGRHLWGEEKTCRPGYGLHDRALGVMYLWGLWDAFQGGGK
jgi:mannonate dehydratase